MEKSVCLCPWKLIGCHSLQERFSNPKSLVESLHQTGIKAIWMLDPGIKHEDGYFVYDSGSKNDVWIQKADGKPFIGIFIFLAKFSVLFFFCSLLSIDVLSPVSYYQERCGLGLVFFPTLHSPKFIIGGPIL